ncbi:MAG: hypothetical protein K9G41_12415 [Flavobacteriales bacterium]|nr:hypothetical protein [Flavobacteriales bacterium]
MITNYNISFSLWLGNLVQWFDGMPKTLAWMRVLLSPLVAVHAAFLVDRTRVNREATYNCQTMVLERALNLRYYGATAEYWHSNAAPTANGHIYIENVSNSVPSTFIYYDVENQVNPYIKYDSEGVVYDIDGVPIPDVYTYYDSEYQIQYDFIVWVPVTLIFDMNEMRAFLDLYVFGGITYTILTY